MADLQEYQDALIEIAETVAADLDPKTTLAQLSMSLSGMEDAGLLTRMADPSWEEQAAIRRLDDRRGWTAEHALSMLHREGIIDEHYDRADIYHMRAHGDVFVAYDLPDFHDTGEVEMIVWSIEVTERLDLQDKHADVDWYLQDKIIDEYFPTPVTKSMRNLREEEVYPELA